MKNPAARGVLALWVKLCPIVAHLKLQRIGTKVWTFLRDRGGLLHGVTFTLKRPEGSLHGEGCLQDVQTALCTSANRWCANLYTYIGLMVPVCSEWYVSVPFLPPRQPCLGICKRYARSHYFLFFRTISSPNNSRCALICCCLILPTFSSACMDSYGNAFAAYYLFRSA